MTDARLLKSQKNYIYKFLESIDETLGDYEMKDGSYTVEGAYSKTKYSITILKHKYSNYYFNFCNDTITWYPTFSPG